MNWTPRHDALPPRLWVSLCYHYLALADALPTRWWGALQQAQGKHAVLLRGGILIV
jgi:hypothetical protein